MYFTSLLIYVSIITGHVNAMHIEIMSKRKIKIIIINSIYIN